MTKSISNCINHTEFVPVQQNSLILDMPLDVVVEIFKHLRAQESGTCRLVCHQWKQMFGDNAICRKLLENHFPLYRIPKGITNFQEAYQDQCYPRVITGIYADYTIDLDPEGSGITSLFISGGMLFTGDKQGKIKIWDLDTKACIKTLDVHRGVYSLVISNRKLIFPRTYTCEINIWDLDTETSIGILDGHTHEVNCLAFSDGKLFSGSEDKEIKIWDLDTNSCIATLKGHQFPIYSLAIFNGKLYSGSKSDDRIMEGMVSVWDLNTKTCIGTIEDGLAGPVYSLLISEGKLLSFFDGRRGAGIKIWDLETEKRIQTFDRDNKRRTIGPTFDTDEARHITGPNVSHAISNGKLYSTKVNFFGQNDGTINVWDFGAEFDAVFDKLADLIESGASKNDYQAFLRFSRMPKRVKNKIYGELYTILKNLKLISNDYWGCGEDAFHGVRGQNSTTSQKAQAIRNYLQEQLKKDSHPLLIDFGIVSSHDYSTKLGTRPAHLEKIGILSAEDLKIICSLSPAIQVLMIEEESGVEENFRDDAVKRKAHQRQKALSDLSDQMSQGVASKIQETNTCGVLLYEGECPWIGFQNRLNAFREKLDAIVLECKDLPKLTVEAFKSAKYNDLVNELNGLAAEFQTLDRDHQIAKLHTYINQWGILAAWTRRKGEGVEQSLKDLPQSERTLQKLFQMGELHRSHFEKV